MSNRQFLKNFLSGTHPYYIIHLNSESREVINKTQIDGLGDDFIIAYEYSGMTPATSEDEVDLSQHHK